MLTDPLSILLWVTALAVPLSLAWRIDEDVGAMIALYLPYWPAAARA